MLRTQIYLPEDLRRKIDKHRSPKQSLSGFIRKASEEKVEKEEKGKTNLKKLADEIFEGLDPKKSGWADIDAVEWQREIRQDRF